MAIETKAQHTPGPWHAGAMSGDVFAIKKRGTIPVCAVPEDGSPNWEADARLIAAAPELLEVVGAIVEQFPLAGIESKLDSNNPLEDLLARAEIAVAKAEGR